MLTMKRFILLIVAAAVALLLSVSCSKDSLNTDQIYGMWDVSKMEWLDKSNTQPVPFDPSADIAVEFQREGLLYYVVRHGSEGMLTPGHWDMNGQNITVNLSEEGVNFFSGNYIISRISKQSMLLIHEYPGGGLLGVYFTR